MAGRAAGRARAAADGGGPAVPEVGWLWDRKGQAALTRQRLQEQGLRPKKSLGQNFLLDDAILANIAAAAALSPGQPVLEVGPGTGNLSRHLLAAGADVTAVEKDDALAAALAAGLAAEAQQAGGGGQGAAGDGEGRGGGSAPPGAAHGRLRIVHGDILRQDLPALLDAMAADAARLQEGRRQQAGSGGGGAASSSAAGSDAAGPLPAARKVAVVANLPYNITKECLAAMLPLGALCAREGASGCPWKLCNGRQLPPLGCPAPPCSPRAPPPQDEVAVRLTARDPGGADWRAMNILVQFYSLPSYRRAFRIDRRRYHPAPGVHGAVIEFALLPPEARVPVPEERAFLRLVKKAFGQRRKVLRNALQPLYGREQVAAALAEAGLSSEARAQDLTLQQFADLAWALDGSGAHARQQHRSASEPSATAPDGAAGPSASPALAELICPVQDSQQPAHSLQQLGDAARQLGSAAAEARGRFRLRRSDAGAPEAYAALQRDPEGPALLRLLAGVQRGRDGVHGVGFPIVPLCKVCRRLVNLRVNGGLTAAELEPLLKKRYRGHSLPRVLRSTVEKTNAAIEVLQQRLPNLWQRLGKALQVCDTLLDKDIAVHLDALAGYGFPRGQLDCMFGVIACVRLLNVAPQTLLDRLAYMEGLLQGDRSVVLRACQQAYGFLNVSQGMLERNSQYCLSLGMSAAEVAALVRERPSGFIHDLTTPYCREVIRSFGRLFGETPLEFMQTHPNYAAQDLSRIECRVAFLHEQGHEAAARNDWVAWKDTWFIRQLRLDAAAYERHCKEWEGSERAQDLRRLRAECRRRGREEAAESELEE
eukprot:scaffold30.g4463.t1